MTSHRIPRMRARACSALYVDKLIETQVQMLKKKLFRETVIAATYVGVFGCHAAESQSEEAVGQAVGAVAPPYYSLKFLNESNSRVGGLDWDYCHGKATCGPGEAVVGMSKLPSGPGRTALCNSVSTARFSGDAIATLMLDAGSDRRRAQRLNDWADGYYKLECGIGEYISAVSENASSCQGNNQLHAVQCSTGQWLDGACSARVFEDVNNEGLTGLGDWDYGAYKGSCGVNEYVAGVSVSPATGRPHSLLCCGWDNVTHAWTFDDGTLGSAVGSAGGQCNSTSSDSDRCYVDARSLRLRGNNGVTINNVTLGASRTVHLQLRRDSEVLSVPLGVLRWGNAVTINFPCDAGTPCPHGDYTEKYLDFSVGSGANTQTGRVGGFDKNIAEEEWTDIALVLDGPAGKARMYVDGVFRYCVSFTGPLDTTDEKLYLGANSGIRSFSGLLDNVEIYNRALTKSEVKRLAEATAQRNAYTRPAASVARDLSRGHRKLIQFNKIDASAWVDGTIECNVGSPASNCPWQGFFSSTVFDSWDEAGFTSQWHGASKLPLQGHSSQRWGFSLPYADQGETYTTIQCLRPTLSDTQAQADKKLADCRSSMNTYSQTAGFNLADRVHILSSGDELDGSYPSVDNRLVIVQRIANAMKRDISGGPFPEAMLDYGGTGIKNLSDIYRINRDANVDLYHITGSVLTALPNNDACEEHERYDSNRTSWLAMSYMGHIRRAGLKGNGVNPEDLPIPYGNTIQGLADTRPTCSRRYAPGVSQIRLAHYAAWTYGVKWTSWFAYNRGDGSGENILFDAETTTPTFDVLKTINAHRSRIEPALVRLLSTDVRVFFANKRTPETFENLLPYWTSRWSPLAAPYLSNISVTTMSTVNGGQTGGVLVGYFRPLSEDLDGPACVDQQYFMVTNTLIHVGSLDTKQTITLEFDFTDNRYRGVYDRLRKIDASGAVTELPLASAPNGRKQLTIELDGGEGELYKLSKAGDTCFEALMSTTPTW